MRFKNNKINQKLNPKLFDAKILTSGNPEVLLKPGPSTESPDSPKKSPSQPTAPKDDPEKDPGEPSSLSGWLVAPVGMVCALGFGGFFYWRRKP